MWGTTKKINAIETQNAAKNSDTTELTEENEKLKTYQDKMHTLIAALTSEIKELEEGNTRLEKLLNNVHKQHKKR